MNLIELDQHEDAQAELLQKHPVLTNLEAIDDDSMRQILLQRMHTSVNGFTPLYDKAIMTITDGVSRKIARKILRDEYPPSKPTHREDLVADLNIVGVSMQEIRESKPNEHTALNIQNVLASLQECNADRYDVGAMTMLRVYGEVLVSAEYQMLVKRMEKMGLTKKHSSFYWPHALHDRKRKPLFNLVHTTGSHADAMGAALVQLMKSEEDRRESARMMEKAASLRMNFWDQYATLVPETK